MEEDKQVRRRLHPEDEGESRDARFLAEEEEFKIKMQRSARINQSFTNFMMLLALLLAVTTVIMTMFPDSHVSSYSFKLMDSFFLQIGASAVVYAIVLG